MQLFIRAKKWTKVTWHVYAAAALAEWTLQRDANVARKIFERGFSDQPGYISEVDYVLAYADFLNSGWQGRGLAVCAAVAGGVAVCCWGCGLCAGLRRLPQQWVACGSAGPGVVAVCCVAMRMCSRCSCSLSMAVCHVSCGLRTEPAPDPHVCVLAVFQPIHHTHQQHPPPPQACQT
jgi:hypothetical protein